MKKIIQFQVGDYGEFYLLLEDGTMVLAEQERVGEKVSLNITAEIVLPE